MCLALPAEVQSIDRATDTAIVAFGPVKKEISVALIEDLAPGDFVLVHVGFALHKVSPQEAARTLDLIRQSGEDPLEEFAA
jgi:hydrogenase expression/formation protein HypC